MAQLLGLVFVFSQMWNQIESFNLKPVSVQMWKTNIQATHKKILHLVRSKINVNIRIMWEVDDDVQRFRRNRNLNVFNAIVSSFNRMIKKKKDI